MNQSLKQPPLTSDSTPPATSPQGLRPLLVLLATLTVYAWVFWPSLSSMAAIWWRSDTFAHGMFIPLISLWLVWRQRDRLPSIPLGSSWLGLTAILIGCLVWLLALATDIAALHQLAAVGILICLIPTLLGLRLFWALLFPILYLLFMVPIGEELTPMLQQVTADITVKALRLSGIPVYINGLFIEIPTGKFEVAEACSGIRYLIASLAVGTLYAYLNYTRARTRLIFMLASLLIPILANGVRAYLIVIIAHLSEMKYATGVDHLVYGWLFFGLVMALMFWLGSFWHDPKPSNDLQTQTPVTPVASSHYLITVFTLALFIGVGWLGFQLQHSDAKAPLAELQLPQSPWQSVAGLSSPWKPDYLGADEVVHQSYKAGRDPSNKLSAVGLYIARYRNESQGKELINQNNRIETAAAWTMASQQVRQVQIDNQPFAVVETELRHLLGTQRRTWHWYGANGQTATNPLQVKLLQGINRLNGNQHPSQVTLISTDYEDSTRADQRMQQFVEQLDRQLLKQPKSS
ncbi:exosortase A [Motiliproteus coralliicola]|uniref:Exosortase A n=1 Tax=Motiliproteus coralliicola TaxID=2283196 RepID=A0A369WW92_9GAMM|nr:exosortase A [Motiliproteus coralliicola]RDE24824.1 exosortase A [Motiliproteus coralliicola]